MNKPKVYHCLGRAQRHIPRKFYDEFRQTHGKSACDFHFDSEADAAEFIAKHGLGEYLEPTTGFDL